MNIIKSDIISLHGAVNSMIGGRPENQDDFDSLDTPLGFFCIVCDGMGGGPGGKTASYIAKFEIGNILRNCNPATPRENAFKMAVAKANEVLEEKMREVPSLNGMGSTFVAILVNQDSALIAHAGDSRCYQIRGKKCIYRSKDHSLVAQLVSRKALTEEEARLSPQANVITRGLGNVSNHVPEIDVVPYKKGDRFILCTDGVWGSMPHKELLHRFIQKVNVQDLTDSLSREVDSLGFSKGGGHDNHTVAIIEMESGSLYRGSLNKRMIVFGVSLVLLLFLVIAFFLAYILSNSKSENRISELGHSTNYNVDGLNSNNSDTGAKTAYHDKSWPEDSVYLASVVKNTLQLTQEVSVQNDSSVAIDSVSASNGTSAVSKSETKKDSKDAAKVEDEAKKVTQDVINEYKKAIELAEPTSQKAQDGAYKLRKQVIDSLKRLHRLTKGSEVQRKVEDIKKYADLEKNWHVYATANKKGMYTLMKNNKKIAKEQIERLDSIKAKL